MSNELHFLEAELLETIQLENRGHLLEEIALAPEAADEPVKLSTLLPSLIREASPEMELLKSLPYTDFKQLGIASCYPEVIRGLPRLYARENPSFSRIKGAFADKERLRGIAVEKALCSLYRSHIPKNGRVVFFNWVLSADCSDQEMGHAMAASVKEALPFLDVLVFSLVPNSLASFIEKGNWTLFYEGDCPLSHFREEDWVKLKSADIIVQSPNFYPHTEELMAHLGRGESSGPLFTHIGRYGWIESSFFNPKKGGFSLGLHFLEKGILTHKATSRGFTSLENSELPLWLFGTSSPGPSEIALYEQSTHFHLASLATPLGGAMYLHALLQWHDRDQKPIDICTSDVGWFIEYLQICREVGESWLKLPFKIERLEIWQGGRIYVEKLGTQGKVIRILCPDSLSQRDIQTLLAVSGEFVAVHNSFTFSEVVSANKLFFLDLGLSSRYFLKDLAALAEKRLSSHRGSLICIRNMGRFFLEKLPAQSSDWVDESYFQREEPFRWIEAAQLMGTALQDPDTVAGFKKFNRILAEEYSCNSFICHLVQRGLYHRKNREIQALEKTAVNQFVRGQISFHMLMEQVEAFLAE